MNKKKKIILILLVMLVGSLCINAVTAKTENVRIGNNTNFDEKSDSKSISLTAKTTTKNFVITLTTKFNKKTFDNVHESPFNGYLVVKSKNSKIKIKSINVKQGNGLKGFKWKTHKINSNKKTIKLGKNTLAMVYQDGEWGQLAYKIKY